MYPCTCPSHQVHWLPKTACESDNIRMFMHRTTQVTVTNATGTVIARATASLFSFHPASMGTDLYSNELDKSVNLLQYQPRKNAI